MRKRGSAKKISNIFSIGRIIPCAITLSALCFGLTAIKFSLNGTLDLAVLCVLFAALFDALDGRAARHLGCSSQFGAELDSLSDLVCFGVAPSIMTYIIALQDSGKFGWFSSLFYAICCAIRLARFNVNQISDTYKPVKDKEPYELKVFFTGVPAPAGAVICTLPLIYILQFHASLSPYVCIAAEFIAGTLMVSKVHTFSSKMIKFDQKYFVLTLLTILVIVMSLMVETWLTVFCLSLLYLILIPFGEREYRKRIKALLHS